MKRNNDSASSRHSEIVNMVFNGNIAHTGIDLPKKTEVKETRQDKYYVKESDDQANQFLFYNHGNNTWKLVKKEEYVKEMGDITHSQTPTQKQVERMSGFETSDQNAIVKKVLGKNAEIGEEYDPYRKKYPNVNDLKKAKELGSSFKAGYPATYLKSQREPIYRTQRAAQERELERLIATSLLNKEQAMRILRKKYAKKNMKFLPSKY